MYEVSKRSVKFVSPTLYAALRDLETVYAENENRAKEYWLIDVKGHQVPFKIERSKRLIGLLTVTFDYQDETKSFDLNIHESAEFMSLRIYDGAASVVKRNYN